MILNVIYQYHIFTNLSTFFTIISTLYQFSFKYDILTTRFEIELKFEKVDKWGKENMEEYKRIKESVEKIMRFSLKDIKDESIRVKFLSALLQAREVLNGDKPSSDSRG